jgi:hypothetical protein
MEKVARVSATNSSLEANRACELAFSFCMTLDSPVPRLRTTYGIYALLIAANIFMGMIVLAQGQVIENQRVLIKNLFHDTTHSAGIRVSQVAAHK